MHPHHISPIRLKFDELARVILHQQHDMRRDATALITVRLSSHCRANQHTRTRTCVHIGISTNLLF
jgi:hypothetical protein